MRKLMLGLAALSAAEMTAGPVAAGCYPYVATRYVTRYRYRDRYVPVEVAVPYAVYKPVYVAQTLPAPTVNYTITTPAPPAQPVAIRQPVSLSLPAPVAAPVAAPAPVPYQAPAAYAQPYAAPAGDCASGHAKLAETLARLEATVTRMQVGPPPAAPGVQIGHQNIPPRQAPPSGQNGQGQGYDIGALLNRRCASCHDSAVAQAKGGNFVMTDRGQLADFDLDKMLAEILSDRMPKGGPPLSEEEKYWCGVWVKQEKEAATNPGARGGDPAQQDQRR